MAKQLMHSEDARKKILAGIQSLADAVKVTMGPTGKVVVIEKSFGAPNVTKDGVTVAKEVELSDPFENMGAQLVKEVSSKTRHAGDGTTTATVLAEAVYREGLKITQPALTALKSSAASTKLLKLLLLLSPSCTKSSQTTRSLRSVLFQLTTTLKSVVCLLTLWTRLAKTALSPLKKPRAPKPPSTSSKVCSSIRVPQPLLRRWF